MSYTVISAKLLPLLQEPIEVKLSSPFLNNGVMSTITRNYIIRWNVDYVSTGVRGDRAIDVTAQDYNYFCFSKTNRITCWPTKAGPQPLNDRGQWKLEGRQEIKPGKFLLLFVPNLSVRTLMGSIVTDRDDRVRVINRACEIFADRVRGMNEELIIEISTDIGAIYRSETHDTSGYLRNSCMRPRSGHGCNKYGGFYNHVPDLKVVYRKAPNGQLLFRALLWENLPTLTGEVITFLDRPYASDPIIQRLFILAQEQGWAYRQFSDTRIISPQYGDNLEVYKELSTDAIRYLHNTGSPYMDTLYYLTRVNHSDKAVLTNNPDAYAHKYNKREYRHSTPIHSVQSTSGSTIAIMDSCNYCSKMLTKRTTKRINNTIMCPACYKTHVVTCDHCHEQALDDHMYEWGQDGKRICHDCASALNLHRCAYCDKHHSDCLYISETDEYACSHCISQFPKCACCGQQRPPHILSRVYVDTRSRSVRVCRSCREFVLVQCGDCGMYTSGVLRFQPWTHRTRRRVWSCDCEHAHYNMYGDRIPTPPPSRSTILEWYMSNGYERSMDAARWDTPPNIDRSAYTGEVQANVEDIVVAVNNSSMFTDARQLTLHTWEEVVNR